MLLNKKMVFMFFVPLLALLQPHTIDASIQEPLIWQNPSKIEVIERYSKEYNVDKNIVYSILMCESKLNPNMIGDGGKSVGIAQFNKNTFERHSKDFGETLDIQSWHDEIKLLAYDLSQGKGTEWTTYQAIKHGGSYTFKNAYTHKIQTIRCELTSIK